MSTARAFLRALIATGVPVADILGRLNDFLVDEMGGRLPGLFEADAVVEGEVEEQEKLARQQLLGRRTLNFRGWRLSFSFLHEDMFFVIRDLLRLPFIEDRELFLGQVDDRISFFVSHIDLDQLKGNLDLILELLVLFFLLGDGVVLNQAKIGQAKKEVQSAPE